MASKPLNIAYCLPKTTGGADLLQQMRIAKGLQERGHNLSFVVPLDLADVLYTKDLDQHFLAKRTWSKSPWFENTRKITWRLQQLLGIPYLNYFSNLSYYDASLNSLPGHDIVQERNGLYKMGVARACKRLNLPYVLFFDADDIFELGFLGEPLTGVLRWRAANIIQYTLRAAHHIVTVSETTKKRLSNVWNVAAEKVSVFPNAVDVDVFRPYPDENLRTRAKYHLDNNPLVIYVGNFYAWHDVKTLIEAFALLLHIHAEARLFLVGDGKQRLDLEKFAASLGVSHAVKFTGSLPREEIPYLLSAADVAVSPYPKMDQPWWGSSMKLFEYLASGTVVIASDVGEQVSEVIRDGENGLLTPPGDAMALASRLGDLLGSKVLREKLGAQGRKDAVACYSWSEYITRLENLYHSVIDRSRYPA